MPMSWAAFCSISSKCRRRVSSGIFFFFSSCTPWWSLFSFHKIWLPRLSYARYLLIVTSVTNFLSADTFRLDLKLTTHSSKLVCATRFEYRFECLVKPVFPIGFSQEMRWDKRRNKLFYASRFFSSHWYKLAAAPSVLEKQPINLFGN